MPENGVKFISHNEILSFEEIFYLVSIYTKIGIRKVRITGGEPLVRKNIVELVKKIKSLSLIEDLSMTTNGIFLNKFAKPLFDAGLDRINVSIDTVDPDKYSKITRLGNLKDLLSGIDTALNVGFNNLKLNTVVMKDINFNEVPSLIKFAVNKGLTIRFIEYMPINGDREKYVSASEIKKIIESAYFLEPVDSTFGNGPAVYYKVKNTDSYVGFITAMSNHFCSSCNRMRLTSDGKLRPCLLSNIEVDVKAILRSNGENKEKLLTDKFYEAISLKPIHHRLVDENIDGRRMHGIGG
jgi:cyclic pyranopterin phosphate synthase